MILQFEQIKNIILTNPNKEVIEAAREMANKLLLHVHGRGMNEALKQCEYFENLPVYTERKKYAKSNKDVFGRLLQQEDMIFSARGGSTYFNLPDNSEKAMNGILDDIRYGMNLRKWVKTFALQAYRCDPMGVIMMEVDSVSIDDNGQMQEPRSYPTYKSSHSIFDYLTTGRRLEYICFQLTVGECKAYGIQDEKLNSLKRTALTDYYRVIDDRKDLVVKKETDTIILPTMAQANPIANGWGQTPGFIVSDLIRFDDSRIFVSPLDLVVELADGFLYDRSVRDLQKKYHGFAKAVEPLLQCPTCEGQGFTNGGPCKSCSQPGDEKGTGYKTQTKVSDVSKFPLSILENGSFDYKRIFGYVTPDIESWEKQDRSLDDLEELIEMTYWGTVRMKRPQPGDSGDSITATESKSNDAPREARLNATADWAERTEMMIADYVGKFWFDAAFKRSSISYGRDYVLKTAEELMDFYQTLRTKGAPDFALDEALEKYYRAKYQNNPVQLVKFLKLLDVEPFPHMKVSESKALITVPEDYNAKLYFGEWCDTVPVAKWVSPAFTPQVAKAELRAYVQAKNIPVPEPDNVPV
jgi:hypothetical protein